MTVRLARSSRAIAPRERRGRRRPRDGGAGARPRRRRPGRAAGGEHADAVHDRDEPAVGGDDHDAGEHLAARADADDRRATHDHDARRRPLRPPRRRHRSSGAAPPPRWRPTRASTRSPGRRTARLWWRQLTDEGWWAWQSFGGGVVGQPSAATAGGAHVRVCPRQRQRGLVAALRRRRVVGLAERGWEHHDRPVAIAAGQQIYVFARGGDGSLYFLRYSNGWSGWQGAEVSGSQVAAVTDGISVVALSVATTAGSGGSASNTYSNETRQEPSSAGSRSTSASGHLRHSPRSLYMHRSGYGPPEAGGRRGTRRRMKTTTEQRNALSCSRRACSRR